MSNMILKAIKYASSKHKNEKRKVSGDPYIVHPFLVAELIRKYKKSKHMEELIVAAILHDVLENTNTNFIEIATLFSPMVASLVFELTSDKNEIKKLKEQYGDQAKNEYLKRKMLGMSSYALVIKLCDRLANIMDNPTEKYKKDTNELLSFLLTNRRISKTQKKIISDILKEIGDENVE